MATSVNHRAIPVCACLFILGYSLSDPTKCGPTGKDCLGGACIDGVCQPFTVFDTVSRGDSGTPTRIAIDGNRVYWTESDLGTVWTVAKNAAAEKKLYDAKKTNGAWGIMALGAVTQNDTGVVVTDRAGGRILLIPVSGTPTVVNSGFGATSEPYGIAKTGTHLYWTDYKYKGIEQLTGGTLGVFLDPADDVTGITTLGQTIFWTSFTGGIHRMSDDGTDLRQLTPDGFKNVDSRFIVTDKDTVFWTSTDNDTVYAAAPGAIKTVPYVVSSTEKKPQGIAIAPGGLYWVDNGCTTQAPDCIRYMPLPLGGNPKPVVSIGGYQSAPIDVAIDDKSVYWINQGDKTIKRLAR